MSHETFDSTVPELLGQPTAAELAAEIQRDDLQVALAGMMDLSVRAKVEQAFLRQFKRDSDARTLATVQPFDSMADTHS